MEESKRKGKTERVMVHVRVRPFNEDESGRGRESGIETIDPKSSSICVRKEADRKNFIFDSVFDASCSQDDIYSRVGKPVVESVLQGYNSTILTYGQTGTGKTHTMIGGKGEARGVIPRAVQNIFDNINSDAAHSYKVSVAFLQIYMEMIQDLLVPDNPKAIRIREDPEEGVYVSGISWVPVAGLKDCMELMTIGDKNRNTAFTHMNSHSSRSHAVYMVKLEKRVRYTREQIEEIQNAGNSADQSVVSSILHLVDLAGSERVKKSKAVGSRLDEAKNINLSLLTLGNCIQALADKKVKFVPYRDSKLTRLLEDSLGGNSKTSLIVTVGPSKKHLQETISSLQFGSRAMKVENRPEINKQIDYKALCSQLQSDLDKINDNNSNFYIREQELLNEISKLKEELKKVTTEKEDLEIMLEELKNTSVRAGSPRDTEELERSRKNDIKKIQTHYRDRLRKQEEEHKKFLEEVDRLMLDQETDLNNMRNDIVNMREKNKTLKREKDSIEKSLSEEISSLREELERVQMLESQIWVKDSEIGRLNKEVDIFMNEKRVQGIELEKLKSENEGLKVGNTKQAADLRSAQELVMQFEAQIKKMKDAQMTMHKDFQMKSKGFSHTIKKYKSGIVEQMNEFWKLIQEDMQKLGYKNKGLDSKIHALEVLLPKLLAFKQNKINHVKSFKLELVDKIREIKLSKDKIVQLTTDITNLQLKSQQQESSFGASYEISKQNMSNLMNVFSQSLNLNISKIYESMKVQEKKVAKLEGVKIHMQSFIAGKTQEVDRLMLDQETELNNMRNDIVNLKEKNSTLKREKDSIEKSLSEEIEKLKSENEVLKVGNTKQAADLRSAQELVMQFEAQIKKMKDAQMAMHKDFSHTIKKYKSGIVEQMNEFWKLIQEDMQKLGYKNKGLDSKVHALEVLLPKLLTFKQNKINHVKSFKLELVDKIREIKLSKDKIVQLTTDINNLQLRSQQQESSFGASYEISKQNMSNLMNAFSQSLNLNISKIYESVKVQEKKVAKLEGVKKHMQSFIAGKTSIIALQMKDLAYKVSQLKNTEIKYEKQLQEARHSIKQIEVEFKKQIETLSVTIKDKEDTIFKLSRINGSLKTELETTSRSHADILSSKASEIDALKSEILMHKTETNQVKTDMQKSYTEKVQDLNCMIDQLKRDIVQKDEAYAHNLKLAKRDISELVSATNTKLSGQISIYAQHIQTLQSKLSSLESVKKLIKKCNTSHSQTITNLQKTLDKTQIKLHNTEQSYKQSISDAESIQKKTESNFQAESSRLNQIISQKDEEIKRLLSDKSMMANNLDSTCRVLNDSLQLQIQQNKALDSKLEEASREIFRLNHEVISKTKDLELKTRELERCIENLSQANEKGKELSMLCSNLENNLKLNRQSYNSAIKLSKETISNVYGNIHKSMQELIKNMSDKIELLQSKVIHLEKVKPLIMRRISIMTISIQDKARIITAIELDLKKTQEKYKKMLEDADRLQKKTEQEYTNKLNSLNLILKQKDEEYQKLTIDKHSIENTVKSLTDAIQSKTSENQSLSESISEAESEISRLKSEIADNKSASNKSSISISQLEKELSTIREDLKSKNQRIQELNSLNTTLQADIKSKEKAFIDTFRLAKRNITQLCEGAAKNMQSEMKRLSNSIQILEIKQRKLQAAQDDIQNNSIKKSQAISKLTSALKDKENQLLNLFSKDKSNYQVIERLRKDQEEIVSAKDEEIQSLKEEIAGRIKKIKLLEINLQNKEQDVIDIKTKFEEKEESMARAMKDYKIESERKIEEANSRIESLNIQISLKDKESGSEISSLNKRYQDTIDNHQQVLESLTQKTKKREEELLYEIEKLSKQLKNKEADYLRLEKKSSSFKSMYDSLKSLVNTLHENLPKIRCKSASAQSWLLKYINIKLPSDSSSYNLLTSVLGVYNSISQNKASLTPQILTQISEMYTYKETENSSIESTQESMPIFREYSEEIYGVVNDMLNLLEAQDLMLQDQTHKTLNKHPAHSRPVIFTGNMTDKSKLGVISNLDRIKVPLNKIITKLIQKPEENTDIISDSKTLAQDAIISLFDSPANTDSMKALHEIGETVDNMKQLLLNLSNFISLLGAYSSTLLNANLSLEKSLKHSQNLLSSLFSLSNYQSIKLHNKRLNHQNTKLRLNFLSQEYTNFKKNLEEETTTTLLKDKSAKTIQRFWRHKLKQRNIRIALKEKLEMLQEKKRRLDELEQFRKKLKEDRLKLKENIQKKKEEIHKAKKKTYQSLKKESKINEEIKKQHQSFSRDQVVQRKMSLKSTIINSRHQRVFSARFIRESIEKEYEVRMKQETVAKEEAEKKLEKLSKIESQIIDMLKKSCEENDKALNSLLEITCPSQKSIQVSSQPYSVDSSVQEKLKNPEARPMSPEREVP